MLFKPELCQAILDDRKTQTRRLVKEGEIAINRYGHDVPVVMPGWDSKIYEVIARNGRLKWQVGRTYAIQPGRGKKAVGRFLLLSIRREQLQDISEGDAEAEGCRVSVRHFIWGKTARRKFANLWDSINTRKGTRWTDDPEVWALTLELNSLRGENGLT